MWNDTVKINRHKIKAKQVNISHVTNFWMSNLWMLGRGGFTVLVLNIWDLNTTAFQLCFLIPHYGSPRKSGRIQTQWKTWILHMNTECIRHHYWDWSGNVKIKYVILLTDAQQKMKIWDWILQILWKYATFQTYESKVRNKNYSHEKLWTDN